MKLGDEGIDLFSQNFIKFEYLAYLILDIEDNDIHNQGINSLMKNLTQIKYLKNLELDLR